MLRCFISEQKTKYEALQPLQTVDPLMELLPTPNSLKETTAGRLDFLTCNSSKKLDLYNF